MRTHLSAVGATIASLSLVALVGSSAFAGHHLPNEGGGGGSAPVATPRPTPKPTPVRILVVKAAAESLRVDEELRVRAAICNEKGRKCKPADNARWTVNKKAVAAVRPRRGAESSITGKSKGIVNVTAKQGGLSGKVRLKVNEALVSPADVDARFDVDGDGSVDAADVTAWQALVDRYGL